MEEVYSQLKSKQDAWLIGFIDGEGCFSISFSLRSKMKHGFEIRPSFSCSQRKDKDNLNKVILIEIQNFFQAGFIRFSKRDQMWKYEVRDLDEICKKIIPYFEVNRLRTSKRLDFEKFKRICLIIKTNHHLSLLGSREIVDLAFTMNISGKRKYTQEFLLKLLDKVKI
ncbi:MAG: LAGLIDADG family homing endonuclease [Candidatus Moeniiplasma glomeromycotorum]|nr:LAGLIDADG family homing endonuclease [Candidatus Moeniiplasma glomeromycotorum]MCE8167305.1 LAGLIDADG family homing endonuclease [Candidatus Moeniiplasma glomeromycotorum]MCE8168682.1 LAGLIDADG family homing endonuclease [Candidatus Moeniiplasma glomeromycotorum]MCE8169740.1 LAGLIDADG family homing endonuclease [Candidatus Moeniiplasma glomeromycotorum]